MVCKPILVFGLAQTEQNGSKMVERLVYYVDPRPRLPIQDLGKCVDVDD